MADEDEDNKDSQEEADPPAEDEGQDSSSEGSKDSGEDVDYKPELSDAAKGLVNDTETPDPAANGVQAMNEAAEKASPEESKGLGDRILSGINDAGKWVSDKVSGAMQPYADAAYNSAAPVANDAYAATAPAAGAAYTALKPTADSAVASMKPAADAAYQAMGGTPTPLTDISSTNTVTPPSSTSPSPYYGLTDPRSWTESIAGKAISGLRDLYNKDVEGVQSGIDAIKGAYNSGGFSSLPKTIDTLKSGAKNYWEALGDRMHELNDSAVNNPIVKPVTDWVTGANSKPPESFAPGARMLYDALHPNNLLTGTGTGLTGFSDAINGKSEGKYPSPIPQTGVDGKPVGPVQLTRDNLDSFNLRPIEVDRQGGRGENGTVVAGPDLRATNYDANGNIVSSPEAKATAQAILAGRMAQFNSPEAQAARADRFKQFQKEVDTERALSNAQISPDWDPTKTAASIGQMARTVGEYADAHWDGYAKDNGLNPGNADAKQAYTNSVMQDLLKNETNGGYYNAAMNAVEGGSPAETLANTMAGAPTPYKNNPLREEAMQYAEKQYSQLSNSDKRKEAADKSAESATRAQEKLDLASKNAEARLEGTKEGRTLKLLNGDLERADKTVNEIEAKRALQPEGMPFNEELVRQAYQKRDQLQAQRNAYMSQLGLVDAKAMNNGIGNTPKPPALRVGDIKSGMRFIGGNPRDKNSWSKI